MTTTKTYATVTAALDAVKIEAEAQAAWYVLLWQFDWVKPCPYLAATMAQD